MMAFRIFVTPVSASQPVSITPGFIHQKSVIFFFFLLFFRRPKDNGETTHNILHLAMVSFSEGRRALYTFPPQENKIKLIILFTLWTTLILPAAPATAVLVYIQRKKRVGQGYGIIVVSYPHFLVCLTLENAGLYPVNCGRVSFQAWHDHFITNAFGQGYNSAQHRKTLDGLRERKCLSRCHVSRGDDTFWETSEIPLCAEWPPLAPG